MFRMQFLFCLAAILCSLGPGLSLIAEETHSPFVPTACEGDYPKHLQGVCTDGKDAIFWSFTTDLLKTDPKGKILEKVPVVSHHGDLCYVNGRVYVAVNLGKFNRPPGESDSWVYVYNSETLEHLEKYPVQEAVHGAGGIECKDGHFFIVGGLPEGTPENYVFEYDEHFKFIRRHVIESGWTKLGIQTVTWHDGAWWFGCYGSPAVLLKTDVDFKMIGRYECNASVGFFGIAPGQFLVAINKGDKNTKRHSARLVRAVTDQESGLVWEKP